MYEARVSPSRRFDRFQGKSLAMASPKSRTLGGLSRNPVGSELGARLPDCRAQPLVAGRLRPDSLVDRGSRQCSTPGNTIVVAPQLACRLHNAGKLIPVALGEPTLLDGGKRLMLKGGSSRVNGHLNAIHDRPEMADPRNSATAGGVQGGSSQHRASIVDPESGPSTQSEAYVGFRRLTSFWRMWVASYRWNASTVAPSSYTTEWGDLPIVRRPTVLMSSPLQCAASCVPAATRWSRPSLRNEALSRSRVR